MGPSVENPSYYVYITTRNVRYNVSNAIISIDHSEPEKQIAANATINIADVEVNGERLSTLIQPRDRVAIVASDGADEENEDEMFTGYVWNMSPRENLTSADFSIKCYDNLVYWQESEDSDFFAAGKSTKDISMSVAQQWGIDLKYEYESITHEKLVLRGAIADFMTADLLDVVQRQTGKKYIIRSEKDQVYIKHAGTNKTVHKIAKRHNATELRRYITLNGVTTQVKILGKASDDEKTPVEATISGDTQTYGTLQKTITRSEDTTLEAAKGEARNIIAESGKPKWEHDIKSTDIPWIRKGDLVEISTDTLEGYYLVKSVNREISNKGKNMTLTVVDT